MYNCNYGTRNIRKADSCNKAVCSLDIKGNIKHYHSVKEAAEILNINKTTISKVLNGNGKNKTAGGLMWFYEDEESNIENLTFKSFKKKIYSIEEDTGNIEHYNSLSEAQKTTGINNIGRALKNGTLAGNRKWFYE